MPHFFRKGEAVWVKTGREKRLGWIEEDWQNGTYAVKIEYTDLAGTARTATIDKPVGAEKLSRRYS